MLKKSAIKRIITSSLALVIMLLLLIFPTNNNSYISEEIVYIDEITMPIYALDPQNLVARTSVIKTDKDEILHIIDALIIDSNTSNYLPPGFNSIIPKNTKLIDYDLKDGLLKLNFSKELLNISKENEEKLIEILTYSLCEIKEVNKIMIFVEGKILDKLPHSKKELPSSLDKNIGVNKVYDLDNIKNTSKTTIYYIGKYNDYLYYIPITKISNNTSTKVEIIVEELKNTPIYETNLISYLNASYELKDYEILENSITISFDNKLIANLSDDEINEEVKYTLALSLRDTYNIEDIIININ